MYLHHQWPLVGVIFTVFSSGILYKYIISIHYKENLSSLFNNYSVVLIGPCNALGVGELEETIRPCSFTIGSETKTNYVCIFSKQYFYILLVSEKN